MPTEVLKITITKTHLYIFDPLKPHFYIVKLGFTGVFIIFLISAQNIDCGYSLEPPRRGGSNEYPQSMLCFEQNYEKYPNFLSEKIHFLVVNFSVYFNRLVFVMRSNSCVKSISTLEESTKNFKTIDHKTTSHTLKHVL